jgi:hypothetical protein
MHDGGLGEPGSAGTGDAGLTTVTIFDDPARVAAAYPVRALVTSRASAPPLGPREMRFRSQGDLDAFRARYGDQYDVRLTAEADGESFSVGTALARLAPGTTQADLQQIGGAGGSIG